jgi:hypothetical protein
MITGIVAQTLVPLPRGFLNPQRSHLDADVFFTPVVASGLDQYLFTEAVEDADDIFSSEMPIVLTSDALAFPWSGNVEAIYTPRVTRDRAMLVGFYTDGDVLMLPDIRIPGVLQPPFIEDDDRIFSTPLILDPGMWRAGLHVDHEAIYEPIIDAADTLFPPLVEAPDDIHPPLARSGGLGPPFVIGDDEIFNFSSLTRMLVPLYVDDARPVLPPTIWDGQLSGVTVSSDGLTAALTVPADYAGARSSQLKTGGRYYFELTKGPTHGFAESAGLLQEGATYAQMTQTSQNNYSAVIDDNANVFSLRTHYVRFFPESSTDKLKEGDVIGMAVNVTDRTTWFRLNGSNWNNDMFELEELLNQDPVTGHGGIPVPDGRIGPAVTLGGFAGTSFKGSPGDSWTANFGAKAYRNLPPEGYGRWEQDSPFTAVNGDSFGAHNIGIPCTLDGDAVNTVMSGDNLTATHNTTNSTSGVRSDAFQRSGKYYFEIRINATHGQDDTVGLMQEDATFGNLSTAINSSAVFLVDGSIWSITDSNKTLGPVLPGDVIGIAVDLSTQDRITGGYIWFRKKRGFTVGDWNGVIGGTDDPVDGFGGIELPGFSYLERWSPAVGFSGTGTAVGDNYTANFGATPYAMVRPNGFAVWSTEYNESVMALQPEMPVHDDGFPAPLIDLANKTLRHPVDYVHDEIDREAIFPVTSFGGNLLLLPQDVVDDEIENIFPSGYFASFDSSSPQVTLSNLGTTAIINTAVAYVGARTSAFKYAGKYYFEVTIGAGTTGTQNAYGVVTQNGTYANMSSNGTNCTVTIGNSGIIFSNNGQNGSMGTPLPGDVIGIAIDLDIRRAWFRRNAGIWNNDVVANPANGVGGKPVQPLVSFAPAVSFNDQVGDGVVANFGAKPFANVVPMGFEAGWSGSSTSQLLLAASVPHDDGYHAPRVSPAILYPELVDKDDSIPLISGTGGDPTVGAPFLPDDVETDAIHPASVFQLVAAFDPGLLVSTTLSNGNLTVTHSSTANNSGARSTSYRTSGKYYFEVTMTNIHGNFDCCGILTQAGTYTNLVTGSSNCMTTFKSSGAIYSNNVSSGKTLGAIAAGDIIGIAVDLDARKGWMRKNSGPWNGDLTHNPATSAGGVPLPPTVAFSPAIGFGGTGTAANDAMTANFGSGAVPYLTPAPAGFNTWPASPPPVLATFDGLLTSVTLSGPHNLIVTHTTNTTNSGARSTALKTSGKYYFEVTSNKSIGQSDPAGIITSVGTYSNFVSSGAQSVAVFRSTGNILGGTPNTKTVGPIADGDVKCVAFDATNRLVWIRKNNGLWNGDALADPVTGAGGVLANYTDSFAPCVGFGGTSTAINDQQTANFGQTPYVFSVPAGYGNWVT